MAHRRTTYEKTKHTVTLAVYKHQAATAPTQKSVRSLHGTHSQEAGWYICFRLAPFYRKGCMARHHGTFWPIRGIPKTMVYDQDRTMVWTENSGNQLFRPMTVLDSYTKSRTSRPSIFVEKQIPTTKRQGRKRDFGYVTVKTFSTTVTIISIWKTLNPQSLPWLTEPGKLAIIHNLPKKTALQAVFNKNKIPFFPHIAYETLWHKTRWAPTSVRKTNQITIKAILIPLPIGKLYTEQGTKWNRATNNWQNKRLLP